MRWEYIHNIQYTVYSIHPKGILLWSLFFPSSLFFVSSHRHHHHHHHPFCHLQPQNLPMMTIIQHPPHHEHHDFHFLTFVLVLSLPPFLSFSFSFSSFVPPIRPADSSSVAAQSICSVDLSCLLYHEFSVSSWLLYYYHRFHHSFFLLIYFEMISDIRIFWIQHPLLLFFVVDQSGGFGCLGQTLCYDFTVLPSFVSVC